jgi:hypothetical protein
VVNTGVVGNLSRQHLENEEKTVSPSFLEPHLDGEAQSGVILAGFESWVIRRKLF